MNKINFFQSILIWAAGFDKKTVALTSSSEINKICVAGSMVFIPAFLALFSYTYGFNFIFGNISLAVCCGVVSAIILFIIDRSIMAYGRPGVFSFGLIGRIFLAVTIGFLLAEPLIIKIFDDSIQEQQYAQLTKSKTLAAIPFDKKIASLDSTLKLQEQKLFELQNAYTQEMDGTGGSKEKNKGPIYQQKYQDYQTYLQVFNASNVNTQAEIAEIKKQKDAALNSIEVATATGLIGKMRALSNLGKDEPIVHYTTWLLRIFFTLIELLPLLIKISPSGDRGLIYKIIDINDDEKEKSLAMNVKERMEYQQKEEQFRLLQAFNELCYKETQMIANAKEKDSIFLMAKAHEVAEKKLNFIDKAYKVIKDESLLKEVLSKFDSIHDSFMYTLNQLINNSNKNYGKNGI